MSSKARLIFKTAFVVNEIFDIFLAVPKELRIEVISTLPSLTSDKMRDGIVEKLLDILSGNPGTMTAIPIATLH